MRILTAASLGLCFGVRDALQLARSAPQPAQITVHGQLVHNPLVTDELRQLGFTLSPENDHSRPPVTPQVLITAHGVSDRERLRLHAAGAHLLDATCPLVRRAHAAALQLDREGFHVLVIGQRGHVEIRGLTEDLRSFDILETLSDVRTFPHPRLGLIAQTTTLRAHFLALHAAIAHQNPCSHIRPIDTICQPTKDRQHALDILLDQIELAVVVGGRHSNNTRQLVATCLERGVTAHHVEHAGELRTAWFRGIDSVGLTAGTSTLPETIAAVHARLEQIAAPLNLTRRRLPQWRRTAPTDTKRIG